MIRRKFQRLEKAVRFLPTIGILLAALAGGGCASVPYHPGQQMVREDTLRLRPEEPQVERGEPYWLIDGLGWVIGIPSKIILWNRKVENHHVTTNTQEHLAGYLAENDLGQVKVRINQYAPHRDWSRLFRNKRVGWGWRYTIGILSCAFYTILPQRIFGGDNYNDYTDTINIYSDIPAVALHEGGHAKDFASRKWKGTYGFAYMLPFVALYHEGVATGDAVGYLRDQPDAEAEKRAYHILYPAYGTYVGGSFGEYVAPYSWVFYAGVIPGHIVGRWKGGTVEERRAKEAAQVPAPVVE